MRAAGFESIVYSNYISIGPSLQGYSGTGPPNCPFLRPVRLREIPFSVSRTMHAARHDETLLFEADTPKCRRAIGPDTYHETTGGAETADTRQRWIWRQPDKGPSLIRCVMIPPTPCGMTSVEGRLDTDPQYKQGRRKDGKIREDSSPPGSVARVFTGRRAGPYSYRRTSFIEPLLRPARSSVT
jgi:hypothetical protein